MTRDALFAYWAPPTSVWSRWAKAVIFAHFVPGYQPETNPTDEPTPAWISEFQRMAIVVDLPGAMGVTYAMALARIGYRPVPLYNACPGPLEVVDVTSILAALVRAARTLGELSIPPDAPPVFMLDALRRIGVRSVAPGLFDNRSISFPTDFPSAGFLREQGIASVLLIQEITADPQADLSHTLLRWQAAGISILAYPLGQGSVVRPIRVSTPSFFCRRWYQLRVSLGLMCNPLGGFGGRVPFPSESGAGG